jgi:hypothetical protein
VLVAVLCSCQTDSSDATDPAVVDSDVAPPVTDSETEDSDVDTDVVVETDVPDSGLVVPEDIILVEGGVQTCDAPVAEGDPRWDMRRAPEQVLAEEEGFRLTGGAVAVADLDADGRLDVFLPSIVEVGLWMQDGTGEFVDQGVERLGGIDLTEATGASIVDVDGDGDLDVFVTRWEAQNVLLINDGQGYFTDGTMASGISGTGRSQTSSWGDMDRDGDLDLFVGRYGPRPEDAFVDEELLEIADSSQVWENMGDGTFLDRSEILPQDVHESYTFMSGWYDLDDDGWTELLIINDFGWSRPSRIFWNTPSGLVMESGDSGFAQPFAGMGLGVGDLNGDEVLDFVQSSWRDTSVLVSNSGRWYEYAQVLGLESDWEGDPQQIFGWGTEMFDIDNDGDLDVVMNFGHWDEYGPQRRQLDAVFIQEEDGSFIDRARVWGMDDEGASRGLAVGDLNRDGRLDVVKRVLDGGTPMYISRCSEDAWLGVNLRSEAPNTFAVGARVRFISGDQVWVRHVQAGGTSMYSARQPAVHVGLGLVDVLDAVEVIWPGGEVSRLERVPTRQFLEISRL